MGSPSGVIDNPAASRFELPVENTVAVSNYRIDRNRVVLTHTEVPQHLTGQGIGSQLAQGVFDAIRASGRKAVPVCPFMAAFVERHPELDEIIAR